MGGHDDDPDTEEKFRAAPGIARASRAERRQEDVWYIGDKKLYGAGAFAQASWPEFPPSHPRRLSEAIPAATDVIE